MKRGIDYLLGRGIPYMARAHYLVELRAWSLAGVPLVGVAGGVAGVVINRIFAGQVNAIVLGLAVALVTGAQPMANVFSFAWSQLSLGRDRIVILTRLLLVFLCCLLLIAMAPVNDFGLGLAVLGILCAHLCWAGVVTTRAAIWRTNYSREVRPGAVARLLVGTNVVMSVTALLTGSLFDASVNVYRWYYPTVAAVGVLAILNFRRLRMRCSWRHLAAEREHRPKAVIVPTAFFDILKTDRAYRRYLMILFVFGMGHLMLMAPLILILSEQLRMSSLEQVLITAALPMISLPLTVPFWGQFLSRTHIVAYRVVHAWFFFATFVVFEIGAVTDNHPLLWVAALMLGASWAGGRLAWNLGHDDFAPPERSSEYMGLHLTLTGVRGLFAPLLGVSLYHSIEAGFPGQGAWVLMVPMSLIATAACNFTLMRDARKAEAAPG